VDGAGTRVAMCLGSMACGKWVGLALVCALGCGGQTESGPAESGGSSAAEGDAGTADGGFYQTPLPACDQRGFLRSEAYGRPCNWLGTDQRCYDTREEACACICPQNGTSQCVSGFYDGDGSATLVSCQ